MSSEENDELIINRVIEREGGFVNDEDDRGGATKFGVTLKTLAVWRDKDVTAEDVKALSLSEARNILIDEFIVKPNYHLLVGDALRAAIVDFAVHSGPSAATKGLQTALGLKADGICGPETLHAANVRRTDTVTLLLIAERLKLMGNIIGSDPSQAKFARGWASRIADVLVEAATA